MKHLSYILFLVFSISTSLLFSACDSSKSDPTPTTGIISGQVQPVNSVATVTATDASNKDFTAKPSSTGAYSIDGLAAGTYTLSFTPATGYSAPATQSLTVTAGKTVTAAAVTLTQGGSGRFTVGSTTTTPTLILGNLLSGNLSITLASTTGRSVVFNLDGYTSTARTYSLANQLFTATQLIYSEQVGTTAQQWTTAGFLSNNLGSGSVVVTSVGSNPRRVSGTFTATAYPATSATTGTRTITGSFTNVPY
ncbi:carboxypeptidase-like regulatory domain-containing protein [Hymenobacter sp. IS2118]|uniref:carboxypeptidase-like regulatory domain-containing protein n=1 Tax=Hymenobacter sp. IS2118 TaxID=1505605 RepID=UPI000552FC89|nr:carboxypeptidase-like regulatory domain-containing protein [Hymenobacter sp. IS2118]